MNQSKLPFAFTAFILAAALAHGVPPAPPTEQQTNVDPPLTSTVPPATTGQTLLYLYYTLVDAPPMPPSRVTVPAGEKVEIRSSNAPADWPVQWRKNGQLIPDVTTPYLVIDSATPSAAGIYTATFNVPSGRPVLSQALVLGVAPAERLVNLSVWNSLHDGAGEGVIAGFVVSGAAQKKMLVRAVGPSLAQFGFAHVLKQPVLRIRDASGKLYDNAYVYPATQGAPTYESDLADAVAKVGAFATLPGAADAVRLLPVAPGSYTVEVTNADAVGGAVLVEIYEVP